MPPFSPLLGLLAEVPDPRRGQGQKYKLPHVLLFSILAVVTGCNSYRGIVTFIDVHRRKLNAAFGLKWCRAPAHTAIRYILKGRDPAEVETVFRQHAARLQAVCATPGQAEPLRSPIVCGATAQPTLGRLTSIDCLHPHVAARCVLDRFELALARMAGRHLLAVE